MRMPFNRSRNIGMLLLGIYLIGVGLTAFVPQLGLGMVWAAVALAAGVFILLHAAFVAALQVIVYAGAIMVLFLFVVMLLNVKGETPLLTPGAAKGFGFLFALLAFVELLWIVLSSGGSEGPAPVAVLAKEFGSPAEIGRLLYSTWLFPFEVTSILLLVAVIGAVVLAKRKFA